MFIRPELIDRLADTLEGIAVSNVDDHPSTVDDRSSTVDDRSYTAHEKRDGRLEANILIYHSGTAEGGRLAGESPLLEINLIETDREASLLASSALGIVEFHAISEVRLLEATEEAAFYSRGAGGTISVLTVSSRCVMQVYTNISESLVDMELTDVSDDDLRAAVALKIFAENAEVFKADN